MDWPPHPRDEWIEITIFGDIEPRYMLGRSGAEMEIAEARAKYVHGQITIEDFEAVLDHAACPM